MQERGTVATLSRAPGTRPEAGRAEAQPRRHGRGLVIALAIAALVVAADQITKSLVEEHIHAKTHILGPLSLTIGYNSGSAFSFFTGRAPVLAVVALVLIVVLAVMAWRARSTGVAVALGLVLGGAIGNLSDRVFRGHHGAVVDFISLPRWPTFNVGDACIVTGVVLFVLFQFRRWSDEERSEHQGSPPAP